VLPSGAVVLQLLLTAVAALKGSGG